MSEHKFKVNRDIKVINPDIWEIVTHGGLGQDNENYPCDVIIENVHGDKWSWRRILPDNSIGEIESGQIDFYKSYNSYNRVINSYKKNPRIKYVIPFKKITAYIDSSNYDPNPPIF